jgi:Ca-activated chloride channel family protein
MKSRILPSLSLLAALRLAAAEMAADYFHEGATNYVFIKTPEARRAVETGLQRYPDDRPLQKLLELLKEQENQQQQQQNDKDQKQEQKKDRQQKQPDQPQKNEQPQGDQNKEQESKKPDPKESQDKKGAEEKDKQDAKGAHPPKPQDQGDKPDPDPAQAARMSAMQMTPQQAQQLLDAHKGKENVMIFLSPNQKGTNRLGGKFKDW